MFLERSGRSLYKEKQVRRKLYGLLRKLLSAHLRCGISAILIMILPLAAEPISIPPVKESECWDCNGRRYDDKRWRFKIEQITIRQI